MLTHTNAFQLDDCACKLLLLQGIKARLMIMTKLPPACKSKSALQAKRHWSCKDPAKCIEEARVMQALGVVSSTCRVTCCSGRRPDRWACLLTLEPIILSNGVLLKHLRSRHANRPLFICTVLQARHDLTPGCMRACKATVATGWCPAIYAA